jgi:AcrR family transcriptional regulator
MDQSRLQTTSPQAPDLSGRLRLQAATADTVAERGYNATTIEDIVKRAGVSRRSFRRQFATKDQCLLAAFDAFAQQVYARVVSSYRHAADGPGTSAESLHSAIETLMRIVATRPAPSWMCLVEARGAGRFGPDRCQSAETYFARLLTTALPPVEEDQPLAAEVAIALVGGIWHVAYRHLMTDSGDRLPALTGQLVDWIFTYADRPLSHVTGNGHRSRADRLTPYTGTAPQPPTADGVAVELAEPPMPHRDRKRQEILHGVAATIRARGYQAGTIHDAALHAGVSTTTFYHYFSSKNQAILLACDQWTRRALRIATESCARAATPAIGIRDAIGSLVRSMQEDPNMAHLVMLDSLALGSQAREFHDRTILGLADLCTSAFGLSGIDEVTLQATTGAVWSILRSYASRFAAGPQPDPTAGLTLLALTPFIGLEAAASHAQRDCCSPAD